MARWPALVLLGVVLLAGCVKTYPSGYDAKDYCLKDSDCVRLSKCCDCGIGEFVNSYHQEIPDCPGPRCLCPTSLSVGACQDNTCVAIGLVPCDALNPCQKGDCYSFPDMDTPVCWEGDPCARCPSGTCLILESYPMQVRCS